MDFPETNASGWITLPNGWTVSVQREPIVRGTTLRRSCGEGTAEIARWPRKGHTSDVRGWQTPEEVAAYISETETF